MSFGSFGFGTEPFGSLPGAPVPQPPSSIYAFPGMSIQAAFGCSPFGTPTWTEINEWTGAFSITRGRQHELQRFEAGTLDLTLNNQDGRFSQWNTDSPYAGGLIPSTPVRIRATWDGITYPVFYGYVDSWLPTYGQTRSQQVIKVTDGMNLLALASLDKSGYDAQVLSDGAVAFWECSDPVGSQSFFDATGNGNSGALGGTGTFGVDSQQFVGCDTAIGLATGLLLTPITPPGSGMRTFEGWFQNTGTGDQVLMDWPSGSTAGELFGVNLAILASGIAAIVAGVEGVAPSSMADIVSGPGVADGAWHHYVVEVPCGSSSGAGYTMWVDGVSYGTSTPAGAFTWGTETFSAAGRYVTFAPSVFYPFPGFTGSMASVAYYTTPLTSAQVANHYELGSAGWAVEFSGQRIAAILDAYGWPTGRQSIATGISVVQAATSSLNQTQVLSYIQTVEATEQGMFFCDASGNAIFHDRHYVLTAPAATSSNGTFTNAQVAPGGFRFIPGSLIPGSDDQDLWTDVQAQRQNGVLQQAINVAAAEQLGYRTLTGFTGMLQTDDLESLALAQWLLDHYDTPIPRVRSIAMDNTWDSGANYPQMLGRQLGDRITVDWKPMDDSDIRFTQDSLVESIKHDVTPGEWTTTWGLSPAETQEYLILDDPVLGRLDDNVLAY